MYVYVAIALFAALASAAGTWRVQEWRYGAKEAERLEALHRQMRADEKRVDGAAEGHEADKVRIRTVVQKVKEEVERVVEKPVYRNICIDDDGLRLVTTAILGTDPASKPAPVVPGPATAHGR